MTWNATRLLRSEVLWRTHGRGYIVTNGSGGCRRFPNLMINIWRLRHHKQENPGQLVSTAPLNWREQPLMLTSVTPQDISARPPASRGTKVRIKLDHYAVALHFMYYDFVKIHQTLVLDLLQPIRHASGLAPVLVESSSTH